VRIATFILGQLQTNCYVLDAGGQAVVIDAGESPEPMLEHLHTHGLTCTHVLCTHLHADHICGVRELVRGTGACVLASQADAYLHDLVIGHGGRDGYPPVPGFEFEPAHPGRMTLLNQPAFVLDTPGHTPGGLSFHFPHAGVVFVGDLLFRGSVGRTDFPGGDSAAQFRSVRERIFSLPDRTLIYPGHGPSTSVEREKRDNPFFCQKTPA